MKKLISVIAFIAALLAIPDGARAQCNGQFGANQVCGSVAGGFPGPVNFSSFPPPTTSVNWINVKSAPCNAVGNGVADDTAAINTCIGNFNTATNGVLYFPAGTYKVTSSLTALTGNGIVRGDGMTNLNSTSPQAASTIQFTSLSTALFTVNSKGLLFTNLALQSTGGTPTVGSTGILVTSSDIAQKVDYLNLVVMGFYIDVDIKVGTAWSMINTNLRDPVLYAVRINNTINVDSGDWAIANSFFLSNVYTPTTAIRIEGSGGGKIANIKINSSPSTAFSNGIDIIGSGGTVDMQITNSSIENFSGSGINSSGSWPNITIAGVEIGSFSPAGTHAINVSSNSDVVINGINLATGFSGTPINLSSCTSCYVSQITTASGPGPFSGGTKPDHDGTGGIGTFYFADGTTGVESRADWHVPAGQYGELRVLLDPSSTTSAAAFWAQNDNGNFARMFAQGSALGSAPSALWDSSNAINIITDTGVASGGTDDFILRTGGTNAAQESFRAKANGHVSAGGTATLPTLTAGCNGAGSVVSGSDANGTITGQTAAATTCTLSFGTAYASAPNCAITGLSAPLTGAITVATGSIVVNFASLANFKWSYVCFGK